jgi:hypothetical protein
MNIFELWNELSEFLLFLTGKFALDYEHFSERIMLANQGTTVYGYESCATPTSVWLHCKLLACSLVREDTLHEVESNCQTKKIKIWSWASQQARHQDELADWPSVAI